MKIALIPVAALLLAAFVVIALLSRSVFNFGKGLTDGQ